MTSEPRNALIVNGGYFALVASVLRFYDHVITFGEEVRCVWRGRFTAAGVLFLVNRYAVLAMSTANLIFVLPWNSSRSGEMPTHPGTYTTACSASLNIYDVSLLLANLAYITFAALRMFALYGMNKPIFVLMLAIGSITPAIQIFFFVVEHTGSNQQRTIAINGLPLGTFNCFHTLREKYVHQEGVNYLFLTGYVFLALRVHALIFEMILVGLTCKKTLTRLSLSNTVVRTPYTTMFLRDGVLYFVAIMFVSAMNMAATLVYLASKRLQVVGGKEVFPVASAATIADIITSICMSRFVLGLLAITLDESRSRPRTSQWRTLRFATIVETAAEGFDADVYDESNGSEDHEMVVATEATADTRDDGQHGHGSTSDD